MVRPRDQLVASSKKCTMGRMERGLQAAICFAGRQLSGLLFFVRILGRRQVPGFEQTREWRGLRCCSVKVFAALAVEAFALSLVARVRR